MARRSRYRLRMSLAATTIGPSQPPPLRQSGQARVGAARQENSAPPEFRHEFDSANGADEVVEFPSEAQRALPPNSGADSDHVEEQPRPIATETEPSIDDDGNTQETLSPAAGTSNLQAVPTEAALTRWPQPAPALAGSLIELLAALERSGTDTQAIESPDADADVPVESAEGGELPRTRVLAGELLESVELAERTPAAAPVLARPERVVDAQSIAVPNEIAGGSAARDADTPEPVRSSAPVESALEQLRSVIREAQPALAPQPRQPVAAPRPRQPAAAPVSTAQDKPAPTVGENITHSSTVLKSVVRPDATVDVLAARFEISPKAQNPQVTHRVIHKPLAALSTAFSTEAGTQTPAVAAIDDADALDARQLVHIEADSSTSKLSKAAAAAFGRSEAAATVEGPQLDAERRSHEFAGRTASPKTVALDDLEQIKTGGQTLDARDDDPSPERRKRPENRPTSRRPDAAPQAVRPSVGRASEAGREPAAAPQRGTRAQPTELPRSVEKVIEAAQIERRAGLTRMNIVVKDPGIGRVAIRMVERAGTVDTMIRADTSVTAQRISDQIPLLLESLSEKGMQAHGASAGNLSQEQERSNSERQQQRDQQSRRQQQRRGQNQPQFRVETD